LEDDRDDEIGGDVGADRDGDRRCVGPRRDGRRRGEHGRGRENRQSGLGDGRHHAREVPRASGGIEPRAQRCADRDAPRDRGRRQRDEHGGERGQGAVGECRSDLEFDEPGDRVQHDEGAERRHRHGAQTGSRAEHDRAGAERGEEQDAGP
jgi:hypothetical protein